jgi:hypothetical protein
LTEKGATKAQQSARRRTVPKSDKKAKHTRLEEDETSENETIDLGKRFLDEDWFVQGKTMNLQWDFEVDLEQDDEHDDSQRRSLIALSFFSLVPILHVSSVLRSLAPKRNSQPSPACLIN